MIVRAGSSPPTRCATATISLFAVIRFKSVERIPVGSVTARGFFDILHHDLLEPQPPPGMARSPIAMIQEQPRHSGTNSPQPDDADLSAIHRIRKLDRGLANRRSLEKENVAKSNRLS